MADKGRLRDEAQSLLAASGVPVTVVPAGQTGVVRARHGETRGRKRKDGERYPSGRLKKKEEPASAAPVTFRRIRDLAVAGALDARMGSEIGRLHLRGEINDAQATTAEHIAAIYARYERMKRMPRRTCASPSYLRSFGDPDVAEERMTPDELTHHERRVRRAVRAYEGLQEELPADTTIKGTGRLRKSSARAMLEQICVEDLPVGDQNLPALRILLDRISGKLGIAGSTPLPRGRPAEAPRKRPGQKHAHPGTKMRTAAPEPRPRWPSIKLPDVLAIVRAVRPDLRDSTDKAVSELVTAITDRRRIRSRKGVVDLGKHGAPPAPNPPAVRLPKLHLPSEAP